MPALCWYNLKVAFIHVKTFVVLGSRCESCGIVNRSHAGAIQAWLVGTENPYHNFVMLFKRLCWRFHRLHMVIKLRVLSILFPFEHSG